MNYGDTVKVIGLPAEKMQNLWGGYDDMTKLLGQTGKITNIYGDGERNRHQYGLEFDEYWSQVTRERTGVIFYKEQLELIIE